MNERQIKRLMTMAAGLFGLVAVVVVGAGLLMSTDVEAGSDAAAGSGRAATSSGGDAGAPAAVAVERVPMDQMMAVMARDLRPALFGGGGSVTAQVVAVAGAGGPLTLKLVGTVVEGGAGRSMALFQMADGSLQVCREGESVEDVGGSVRVQRVGVTRVAVEHGGAVLELEMEAAPAGEVIEGAGQGPAVSGEGM
jgi:hypothetical protein